MTSAPAWLAHYVTTSGNPDPRRAGRAVRPKACPGCGRLVLYGADNHVMAAYVDVDPYRLDPAQEAAALIARVPTCYLRGEPPKWELRHRAYPGIIPIGIMQRADECVVVAYHDCTRAPFSTTALATRRPATVTECDRPPF